MVELRALHFTDVHEDTEKLEAIVNLLKKDGDIDLVLGTGDYTGQDKSGPGDVTYENKLESLLEEMGIDSEAKKEFEECRYEMTQFMDSHDMSSPQDIQGKINRGELPEEDLQKLQELSQKMQNSQIQIQKGMNENIKNIGEEKILALYDESLGVLKPYIKQIRDNCGAFVSVAGNHDLAPIYEAFKDYVEFVDHPGRSGAVVKGRSGKAFNVKGMVNSWESSLAYQGLKNHKYWVDKISGISIANAENEEQKELFQHAQAAERQRLGNGDIDIMLFHKHPVYRSDFPEGQQGDSQFMQQRASELSEEFQARCASFAGHYHTAFIRVKNGQPMINPGRNYVAIIDYDKDKKIEKVTLIKSSNLN